MSEQQYTWRDLEPDRVDPVFSAAHDFYEEGQKLCNDLDLADVEFGADRELHKLAIEGISEDEQQLDMRLREFGQSEPVDKVYGAIGHFLVVNSQNVAQANARLAALNEQSAAKSAQVDAKIAEVRQRWERQLTADLDRMKHISPNALDDARRLLIERTEAQFKPSLLSPAVAALEDEQLAIMEAIEGETAKIGTFATRSDELDALIVRGGEAWPLPSAYFFAPEESEQSTEIALDELPVEPVLSEHGSYLLEGMRERHIDQPDASMFTALYLIEAAGKAVSVRDLGTFLYSEKDRAKISETGLRSRITTVLGPARNIVGRLLDEEGYVLQYGWRRMLDKTGGKVKIARTHRIYRALSKAEAEKIKPGTYETEDEAGNYRDEFVVHASETTGDEKNTEATDTKTEEARTEEVKQSWVARFKVEIGEALGRLEQLDMLESDKGMEVKIYRFKHPSRRVVTATGFSRAINAGLLSDFRGIEPEAHGDFTISPVDMVVLELFKERKSPLSKDSPIQEDAVRVIKESVEAYFRNRQQAAEARKPRSPRD